MKKMKEVLSTHTAQLEQLTEKNDVAAGSIFELEKSLSETRRKIECVHHEIIADTITPTKDELAAIKLELKETAKKVAMVMLKDDSPSASMSAKFIELRTELSALQTEFRKLKTETHEQCTAEHQHLKSSLENELDQLRIDFEKTSSAATGPMLESEIDDLRKEIVRVSTDVAVESKKITSLEELFTTQRRELFSNVSEMEGYFISKIEALKRHLQGVAQKAGYTLTIIT